MRITPTEHRILIFLCLSLAVWLDLRSQTTQLKTFQVAEGLPSSFLTDLAMAPDGHIWLASDGAGLSKFDGLKFENFTSRGQLGGLYFKTLAVDAQGQIWAGGDEVLTRFDGTEWHYSRISGTIHHLLPFQNRIICSTDRGLQIFDPVSAEITEVHGAVHSLLGAIEFGRDLVVLGADGLFLFDGVSFHRLVETQGKNFRDLTLDDDDLIWLVDDQGSIYKYISDEVVEVTSLPAGSESTFIERGDMGTLFIGTATSGVFTYATLQDLWLHMEQPTIRFAHATAIHFDPWNNAWLTTRGHGLVTMTTSHHTWLDQDDGLSGSFVKDIRPMGDALGVSYNNGRADIISGSTVSPLRNPQNQAMRILDFDIGQFAAYATDRGLFIEMDSTSYLLTPPGRSNFTVNEVQIHSDSTLWVGSSQGLFSVAITANDGQPEFQWKTWFGFPILDLQQTTMGIWCIMEKDLALVQDGELEFVHVENQMDIHPTDLHEYAGITYVSSRDHGLFYLDQTRKDLHLHPCLGQDLLPSKQVQSFGFNRDGEVFIGTNKGIFRSRFDANQALQTGYTYDQTNGLPLVQLTRGAAQLGPSGAIYFGTTTGLLQLGLHARSGSQQIPILSMVKATMGPNEFYALKDIEQRQIEIPSSNRSIHFQMKCIDLSLPQGITYWWKIPGLENVWQKGPSDGSISFLSLPSGKYSLQIKAMNRDLRESNIIQASFRIGAPYYFRWWFVSLVLGAFLSAILLLYRTRVKRIERLAIQNQEAMEIQNEMLRLEQSALKLQMNPHFIFNALHSIQAKIGQNDAMAARSDLQRFSKLMRNYLDQARQPLITLEEEIDALTRYLSIERSLKDNSFDFSIDIPKGMDPSFFQLPPMLIQPFAENAVKHGLPPHDRGKIEITFSWLGKYLSCVIEDNGPGFSTQASSPTHASAGMTVTRSRLESLHENNRVSPLEMENISDANGQVRGARVILVLPVKRDE